MTKKPADVSPRVYLPALDLARGDRSRITVLSWGRVEVNMTKPRSSRKERGSR